MLIRHTGDTVWLLVHVASGTMAECHTVREIRRKTMPIRTGKENELELEFAVRKDSRSNLSPQRANVKGEYLTGDNSK